MSGASDAASDFGRLRVSTSTGMATRSQTQAQRGAAGATASASRGQQSAGDGDSDDEGGDSGSDDEDVQQPQVGPPPPIPWLIEQFAPYDPNGLTPDELHNYGHAGELPPNSENFYWMLRGTTGSLRQNGLPAGYQDYAVRSEKWSQEMVVKLITRLNQIFFRYDNRTDDAAVAVDSINKWFRAVEQFLGRYKDMPAGSSLRLIQGFQTALRLITARPTDMRDVSGGRTFAGGATHHEHNMFWRFVHSRTYWLPCVQLLRTLIALGFAPYLAQESSQWRAVYTQFNGLYPKQTGHAEFSQFLRLLHGNLSSIGVMGQ